MKIIQPHYTISENYNSFLWLPPKTGTHILSLIFLYFKFKTYKIENSEIKILPHRGHFGHHFFYPDNHSDMTFICSIRNPYDRFFSWFKTFKYPNQGPENKKNKPTKIDFDEFCQKFFSEKGDLKFLSPNFNYRFPDYVIRNEFLFEDLSKIPFIKESKFYLSGVLEEFCQEKLNPSSDLLITEYYDEEIKNKIYESFKTEFELGGYQR